VTGIKFDAAWVGGYGALAANSADALAEGVSTMAAAPLTEESFGELGRTIRTAEAYDKAAQLLRGQLGRAVEALTSASDGLAQLTAVYQDTEDEGVRVIRREQQL
jgi:hypothetical protein